MKTSLAAILAFSTPLLLVCHSALAAPVGTDVQIRTHEMRQLLKMLARAQETPSEVRRGLLTMFAAEPSEDDEGETQESSEKRSGLLTMFAAEPNEDEEDEASSEERRGLLAMFAVEPSGDEEDEASSEERRGLLTMFAAEPPVDDEETASEER